MGIQNILLCIILHHYSLINIAESEAITMFPALPRTGQVINRKSSNFPSASNEIISSHYPQSKAYFNKAVKTNERNNQIVRIAGNAKRSSPMFITMFNMNLPRSQMVNQQALFNQTNLNDHEEWQSNKSSLRSSSDPEIPLKQNIEEEIDAESKIRKLKKLEITEASCISNIQKQKYIIFKEYLHFWNLFLKPADLTQNSLDILRISMINRKCSTNQKPTLCCKELSKSIDFANKDTNICNISHESKKYHEFCVNSDRKNDGFFDFMEYSHEESSRRSNITSGDLVQTIIYNETNTIVFGQNNNTKNPEFQLWTRQKLQNLDIALALNNHNNTVIYPEKEQISNSVLLNQWIGFAKFNETRSSQVIKWQLLKKYQQYDEKFSSNLIRICITNQELAEIICTEQYYYNICHLNDFNECIDDNSTLKKSIICRYFTVDDKKVEKITEHTCDSLNESVIFWDYQRKVSESTTGILILQQIRTTINHFIPIDQSDRSEKRKVVKEETENKRGRAKKLKTNEELESVHENIVKITFPELFRVTDISTQFIKTNHTVVTISPVTQMSNQINPTVSEDLSEIDVTTTGLPLVLESNPTNVSEIRSNFDESLNDTTIKMTNNDINEINAKNKIEFQTIVDSPTKTITESHETKILKSNKQSLWKPFHFDCNLERDKFSTTSCSSWAMAGYCLSNNATRFLWCRKTCLCVGPQQL